MSKHHIHLNMSMASMDKLQLSEQNQGWVFNSRNSCMFAMYLCYEPKQPNLKSKKMTQTTFWLFHGRYDTQHNDIQHNDTQHNSKEKCDTQHKDSRHNSRALLCWVSQKSSLCWVLWHPLLLALALPEQTYFAWISISRKHCIILFLFSSLLKVVWLVWKITSFAISAKMNFFNCKMAKWKIQVT